MTKTSSPLRIGILGSGRGSNCLAILEAIKAGRLQAEVVCVISDVVDAGILEHARQRGIPAHWVDGHPYKTKLDGAAEQQTINLLQGCGVEVVVLAGYMRIIKQAMLDAFPNRILNIHPALLPAFPGTASWTQALDYGVKVAGCTVHIVDAGTDTGPILVQRPVSVRDDDTPESLHARIQAEEHLAYPEALQLLAENRLRLTGRRVVVA
ncbi:MAG: phosphoribosylglycinamide formyltransferase [Verrucomicrobia bacterium]|nr:phosphoribosylglycinamide formyltransferase [Verrucomicrobiota bacterium]